MGNNQMQKKLGKCQKYCGKSDNFRLNTYDGNILNQNFACMEMINIRTKILCPHPLQIN